MRIQVPNVQLYTPVGAQLLATLDSDALNSNFSAIAAAFSAESSLAAHTADVQLSNTLRNVLVDVSGNAANSTVVVTLPGSPAIGDPPCLVAMKSSGNTIPANCIVTTSDGSLIGGLTPDNTLFTNQPSLHSAGDSAIFVFLGDILGWAVSFIGTAVTAGAWSGSGALPWQDQTVIATAAGITLAVDALQVDRAHADVINVSTGSISIGDAASTFNGVAGPYTMPSGTLRHIACSNAGVFTVTA